ncbi:MAG: WXG100 family type VII secretion target [Lachnospiraceae bacterium]|nr:WXG100 family type VII secretion target [Lachnospiraceae bacterium]
MERCRQEMKIYIDYQDTINKARELENLAGKLRLAADQKIGGTQTSLAASWTGDSAEAFRTKLAARQTKIRSRAEDLEKTAKALRRAAENMKRAEDAARAILGF